MTLQEYLVKLGWSIDEPSMKRFFGVIASTSAGVAELGSTAIETAGAIEAMVSRVARKYETLYYMSQRNSQSVRYIQSTQFAFKQIGLSAEEANQSIESIGATLRTQPWLRAIFGNATTPQQIASKLGKSGLPYFLQTRFAEMIGMDEKTLFHLQRFADVEAAGEARARQRMQAAGIDPEKLAEQSTVLGRRINDLEGSLEVFGDRMAADFIGPVTKGTELTTQFVDWITRLDVTTKGWASTLGALAGTAGGLLVVEKIIRRILGLSSATATGGAIKGAFKAAAGGGLLKGGIYSAIVAALMTVKQNDPETRAKLREALGPVLYELGLSKSPDLTDEGLSAGSVRRYHRIGKLGGRSTTPAFSNVGAAGVVGYGNTSDRINQVVNALVAAGYPLASAQGIAAGLYSESKLDPKSVNPTSGAAGIAQWLGGRKKGFKDKFLTDVEQGTFEEQLQYLINELQTTENAAGKKLKAGGMSAREAAGTYIHLFERPGPEGELSDMSRAGPLADALSRLTGQQNAPSADNSKTFNINSKVDVHPPPGADVMSTAKAYGDAHDDANQNLLRNLQGMR